ncbi:Uncharacterised protein [Salmonella enterica subsp. enterica serovar Braenderup]|nr:Uncharacterised protein [Salmonella enterica subsp. enterica serovar Braenderup]
MFRLAYRLQNEKEWAEHRLSGNIDVIFIDLIMQAFIYLFCLFLCGAAATVLQIWLLG